MATKEPRPSLRPVVVSASRDAQRELSATRGGLASDKVGTHTWSIHLTKEERPVRIGASLVLIAIGAILKFAVTTSVSGVNLATVGVVLMVVGIVGLVLSIILASTARRTDVVHH
jgi:hypothetical protein